MWDREDNGIILIYRMLVKDGGALKREVVIPVTFNLFKLFFWLHPFSVALHKTDVSFFIPLCNATKELWRPLRRFGICFETFQRILEIVSKFCS